MDSQLNQPSLSKPPSEANSLEALDVAALTRWMKKGDDMAYRTFYNAYYPRLWRYLLVVSAGDEQASREALQSALVRVVRHIRVFPDDASFWGWLTVLARTSLSDQNRGRRRYLAFLDRFTRHAEVEQSLPVEPEVNAMLLNLLETNLASMPTDERALVEAKYFDRRSVRDIACELGTSEKAVESRLTRVRQKLKLALLETLKNGRAAE